MSIKKIRDEGSDSILQAYYQEISRYKLLSFTQELEYSRQIEMGNKDALNALVNANLRLVLKIAKSYTNSDMGLMDLIQEGNMGLIKAAQKYDYRKKVRFSTYSSWWIKQSIRKALMKSSPLPRRGEYLNRIQHSSLKFVKEYCRWPSMEELAAYAGIHVEKVRKVLETNYSTVSLDAEINKENSTMMNFLEDKSYNRPDEELIKKNIKEDTLRFLNILPDVEKKILMYRFAMDGRKKQPLRSIGDKIGFSSEAVRQIEIRALKKLRGRATSIRKYFYN